MLTDSFFWTSTEGPYYCTASSENVSDFLSYAYMRKYYHLFKQNVLSDHNRKITHY